MRQRNWHELARRAGIIVPRFEICDSADGQGLLPGCGGQTGLPSCGKAESPDILHKTEAGGVVLGIRSKNELASAAKEMSRQISLRSPGAAIRYFLLEKMMPAGSEVLIGGLRDPQFGPTVAFGLGGIWTEALADAAFGIVPLTRGELIEMMEETKASLFFQEFRGSPPLDREAVLSILTAVSSLMTLNEPIREIDLNPVRVYPRGAAALDVRVLLAL